MRILKSFKVFESESNLEKLIGSFLDFVETEISTDYVEMDEWIHQKVLNFLRDEYLDSEGHKDFVREKIKDSNEFRDGIEQGEDPDLYLDLLTLKSIEDENYWEEYIEESGFYQVEYDNFHEDVNFLFSRRAPHPMDIRSKFEFVKKSDSPIIDVFGNFNIDDYTGSFLPFKIRSIEPLDLEDGIDELNKEFQEIYALSDNGSLMISSTDLVAIDDMSIDSEYIYINDNPRLISLEGITSWGTLKIGSGNCLAESILRESTGLKPDTGDSIEFYSSLLDLPETKKFDSEQMDFILGRIGMEKLQKMIDDDPERMIFVLKPVLSKILRSEKFNALKFPKNLRGEADLIGDLYDIGF